MSNNVVAAKNYPDDIFKQTSPDETQEVGGALLNVLTKSWQARSMIYEISFADEETNRLRIQGPFQGGAFMSFLSDGGLRLRTGQVKTQKGGSFVAGSGMLGIKAEGGLTLASECRGNLYFNAGRPEDEEQGLNLLSDGDIITQARGSEFHVLGKTIVIDATDELILKGLRIRLECEGKIEMAAANIVHVTQNKKEIITGQDLKFGAGETTDIKIDPRSSKNDLSPGQYNIKVAGDYKVQAGGCVSLFGLGGPGTLITNRSVGMGLSTKTKFAAGGTASSDIVSTGFTTIKGRGGVEVTTTGLLDMSGTSSAMITSEGTMDLSANIVNLDGTATVRITGGLIYLN